jgi:hypothetical protein
MEKPENKPDLRLNFQGSIPFESADNAEIFYTRLKEMVKSQSEKSIINGQVSKMLEPCCKKNIS